MQNLHHLKKWLRTLNPNSRPISILNLQQSLNHPKTLDPKSLHAFSLTSGLISNPFIASRIVQLLLSHNKTQYATAIFDSLTNPDVYTWNLMLATHTHSNIALSLYFRMRASGLPPNNYTFALVLKSCCGGGELAHGRLAHGQVLKCGVEDLAVIKNSLLRMYCNLGLLDDARALFDESNCLDLISWNTMVSGYGKNGDVEIARKLFDEMPERNLVSWSVMIDGYVRKGESAEALALFRQLREEGVEPDEAILASALKACANLGALDEGRLIHSYIDQAGLAGKNGSVVLSTAIVNMYCKCGCVEEAIEVFDIIAENGDVVLWNAMISGLANHGDSQHALELFRRMKLAPNESTYVAVLCTCTHAGLVDKGIEVFESMKRAGVDPRRDHYGCLANLLGRSGRVREAEQVLLAMPVEPQAAQWGALMAACRMHEDVEVGERVGRRLIEMEPFDGGRYILLANLYTDAGQWQKASDVRAEMERRGVKKETGCSSVD